VSLEPDVDLATDGGRAVGEVLAEAASWQPRPIAATGRALARSSSRTALARRPGRPSSTPPAVAARIRDDDVAGMDELRARLDDPSLVLVDTRSPERWRGDTEPLDPVAGRIPGARNAYFEAALPEDLLDAPELVVYCGSGVSAVPVLQKLIVAGRDDARLYPGSFSEWCRDPSNPIERGDP